MKIAVLGAGVIGLTTAYYLALDGHEVEVIERHAGVALDTSFGNGAQLCYSYVAPLAGPGVLCKVPGWLLSGGSPLRFRPEFDPQQWLWLLGFARACNQATSDLTRCRQLALSFYSRSLMREFVARENFDFGHAQSGKLVAFTDQASFNLARKVLDSQRVLGCEQEALDREACIRLEPSLGDPASTLALRLVGGIHTASDEVGDCYRFCRGLEAKLHAMGVVFRFDTPVKALRSAGTRVTAIETEHGDLTSDGYVLSLGVASSFLARPLGIRLPIYPLKGYSLTLAASGSAPRISVTDYARKVVYAPLNLSGARQLRVAGMAEVSGYSSAPDPRRVNELFLEASKAFPAAADYTRGPDAMQPWMGLRPATPKSTPILGCTPYSNLFLNCGHGGLGWTLALGSARVVADLIAGVPPAIAPEGYDLDAQ